MIDDFVISKGRLPNETSDSEFHSDMEPVKPRLKMGLQDTEAQKGDKVRLDCVIVGQPEPEVRRFTCFEFWREI